MHQILTLLSNTLITAQQTGDYAPAATLLSLHAETLLAVAGVSALADRLAAFPPTLINENHDLCYVAGLLCVHNGQIAEAVKRLERARFSYMAHQQVAPAVRCSLELARLYCSREAFQTAYYHLHDQVQPWIEQGVVSDPTLRARFYLRMAEIMPDIGRFAATVEYAHQALAIYQAANDIIGQYFALVCIASALLHLTRYSEMATTITLARECLATADFGPMARLRLLNLEIHYHWHRGQLEEAVTLAHTYVTLVDQEAASNFRVYARILLANLYRALGCFAVAGEWYTATRQVTAELADDLYQPWIDAQVAWLYLLQAQLDKARRHIHVSLQTADLGQAMSFQITLALIYLQEEQPTVAARLLTESLTFYQQSGDELAVCTIHGYLALTSHRQEETAPAKAHLCAALGWMAQRHLDYLPYWWHPPLLSELCALALTLNLYPDVVERIVLNHLRAASKATLKPLLLAANPMVAQRAYHLLYSLGDTVIDLVAHLPDGPAKDVLIRLLESGKLVPAAYPYLEQELKTATHRPKPNPTLMAVFGLYVNGAAREEIAEQLACSLPGVRNYITTIYEHFGVATDGFATRRTRWLSLIAAARAKGFIY